jgi:hypothetical protein
MIRAKFSVLLSDKIGVKKILLERMSFHNYKRSIYKEDVTIINAIYHNT